MYSYSYNKEYNLEKLNLEIAAAGIPMMSMDLISNTHFVVNTAVQLSNNQQAVLNQVVASHVPISTLLDTVANRILAARSFGTRVIARYGAANVLAGYSIEQIQEITIKTAKVQAALNTGSLYVAITEINNIQPDGVLITTEKLKAVRNEIEDYLQIPRT
jgi:hypothetical protein